MPLTPAEIRHIELQGGLFGYRKGAVHQVLEDVAESFEAVWSDRARLVERVEGLELEVRRHIELEGLLRSTLISAERASQDMKESGRREADVIVTEANAEARKILRDAITQKQALMADVHRIQALLRSSLEVVAEAPLHDGSEQAPARRPAHPAVAAAVPAPKLPDSRTGPELRQGEEETFLTHPAVAAAAPAPEPPEDRTDPGLRKGEEETFQIRCPACGSPQLPDEHSCTECGEMLIPPERPIVAPTAQALSVEPKSGRGWRRSSG